MDEHEVTRREVLARSALSTVAAVAACAACGAAPGGLTGCGAMEKKRAAITTGKVNIGPAEQFPAGTANGSLMSTYGIIITNDSGTALAIRPKCTHQGCTVKWNPAHIQFECPCHGSEFDLLGRATHGPAKKSLPGVAAERLADGTLTVDLDKLYAM